MTMAKIDNAITSLAHPNFSLKTLDRYRELIPYYHRLGLSAVEINTAATKEWTDMILASQMMLGH